MPPDVALRAADADRESVTTQLSQHLSARRIDLAEYDDRVALAYAATHALLAVLGAGALGRRAAGPDGATGQSQPLRLKAR